jgi:CBS domain containing-hemolysin-like protein
MIESSENTMSSTMICAMIGLVLVVDGFGIHVPKGYVYAAIGFALLIEILNQLAARRRKAPGGDARAAVADAVLRLLGGVPLAEKQMVEEVLTLDRRPVSDVMTPRAEVVWLDASAPQAELLSRVRATPHREFPVGRGSIDRVLGQVRKEDLLAQCLDGLPIDLQRLLRPPVSVREDSPVLDVVDVFRREPAEMAIVVDAGGLFKGVVTREDLLEAIAGDMPDSGRPQPVG